jgi:hypothetical protein
MPVSNPIGGYRDAHIEIEKLARATGPILESAVQELIHTHAQYYRNSGPDLKHVLTGNAIEDDVAALRKTKPHYYADFAPVSEEQALADRIEDAMLTPTLTKLGKLYTELGAARFEALCKEWDCDATRLKPGRPPEYARRPEAKKATNRANNPWSKEGWNISRQGAFVTSQGIEKAAALARAVGCTIGSTRPNLDPKFN